MKPVVIEAKNLDEAWFAVLRATLDDEYAYDYSIQKGSFEGGGTRRQLHSLTVSIECPETRPLAPMVPDGFSPPTTPDNVEKYFAEKLLNPELAPNEEYNYAQWIVPNLPHIAELLASTPYTNHAVINVGDSLEYDTAPDGSRLARPHIYEHPPCLRCLHWVYRGGKIHLYTFWRSWDLFAGFPENLGGMQLLNELMAMETGYETGTLNAFSSGAHIYGYHLELVEARMGRKLGAKD